MCVKTGRFVFYRNISVQNSIYFIFLLHRCEHLMLLTNVNNDMKSIAGNEMCFCVSLGRFIYVKIVRGIKWFEIGNFQFLLCIMGAYFYVSNKVSRTNGCNIRFHFYKRNIYYL